MTAIFPAPARIVVLGSGNPSRGDDALGPALMERVAGWIARHPERPVVIVEDFQLQVEHALDLRDRDLILFVDAAAAGPDPYAFRRCTPAADRSCSTHALSPEALLHTYASMGWGPLPPAFTLAVRGHDFELGEGLSLEALRNQEAAWAFLARLLEHPNLSLWEELGAPCEDMLKPS